MEQRDQAKKQNTWIPTEAIGNNIDLLTEILLRVPAKPLIKFKRVSKQWLSLISDPQFCLSHTRHHHTPYPTPTALLLKYYGFTPQFEIIPLKHDTIPKVPLFHYHNDSSLRIKQSCNGLLLCSSKSLITINTKQFGMEIVPEYTYFICNPTTKQFKQLSFPSHQFKDSMVALNLAFDPLKSTHYNVISIGKVKEHKFRIGMYSSETDSWSLLRITFEEPYHIQYDKPVFCNDAIHWDSDDVNSLYFDIDNKCLKTMPMPALTGDNRHVLHFGESCGRLHAVVTYNPNTLEFDVLEMAADYSQWFMRYHVDLDAARITSRDPARITISEYIGYLVPFFVLGVIRADKEEESMVVLFVDGKVVSYYPYNGTSKPLCDLQPSAILTSFVGRLKVYQCFEILSCV